MSKRPRWLVLLSVGVVVLLAGTIALLSLRGDETASIASKVTGDLFTRDKTDAAPAASASATTAAASLGETPGTPSAKQRKVAVKDTPAPPPSPDPAAAAWQQYLAETKKVVETNEASLASAVAAVTAALTSDDGAALEDMLATDEGVGSYGEELAERYPELLTSQQTGTVNIFTSGQATIYIAYTLVTWQDAGMTSEHTIPIVLRFVNGEWVISSLGDTETDLQFVQTVAI